MSDLISREALKFELRQQLAFQKEKAKLTTINIDKMAHSLVATGIQLAIDIIDNAPTVTDHSRELVQKSIELGHRCGYFEGKIENKRPQGVWYKCFDKKDYFRGYKCSKCEMISKGLFNFCPNCGADMRGDKNVS